MALMGRRQSLGDSVGPANRGEIAFAVQAEEPFLLFWGFQHLKKESKSNPFGSIRRFRQHLRVLPTVTFMSSEGRLEGFRTERQVVNVSLTLGNSSNPRDADLKGISVSKLFHQFEGYRA